MKRLVKVFIEGVELELFNDEQINVTSSVQNISDISKVFTDFSQSFTVPASPHNNEIFKHFYQTDIQPTIDHNYRRNAFIEIDLTTFRRGKIQLEKSNIKNGQVDSYTITFYGDILSLKDKFGEDKLNILNLSALEFTYTGANVYNRITDLTTDYDVRYPLITSDRFWQYHTGGSTIDITDNAHAINYSELFPAVKINRLFQSIANDYGVTFQGTFLSDPRFTNCFLWCKNTNQYTWYTELKPLDFDIIQSSFVGTVNPYDPTDYIDLINNSITLEYLTEPNGIIITHKLIINSSGTVSGTQYIEVYQNGNLYTTLQVNGTAGVNIITINNNSGLNSVFTFKAKASATMTLNVNITYEIKYFGLIGITPVNETNWAKIKCVSNVYSGNVSINNNLPDIKISDFFAGILKEFNMTCVGTDVDTYEILPLDEWYGQGAIVDITQYTDTDSIDIERIKLYKKINFKYQESESFVNKQFFKATSQQYGNLEYQFDYDGDEYNIESPFENLLFTRAVDNVGDYAILGYALNENYNAYTPKPCLFYLYGSSGTLAHNIKFFNGSTTQSISSYALFGQDLTYQNTKYSLNFGAENSIIHNEVISQGLYASYYFPYLSNLFNLKNRLITLKTILPISLLTQLRLNDRLIIRDKRYIINEMKSNLTSGEVDFSLYLDFRPLIAQDIINPNADAQCLDVRINLPNGATEAEITTDYVGVTITPSTLTSSDTINVCIPENTDTTSYLLAENSDFLITEEEDYLITDNSTSQTIILTVTYTYPNGTQSSNQIIINQQ